MAQTSLFNDGVKQGLLLLQNTLFTQLKIIFIH